MVDNTAILISCLLMLYVAYKAMRMDMAERIQEMRNKMPGAARRERPPASGRR